MMQQPLLPVTVKNGDASITPDNTCNRCVCAYIMIMGTVITTILVILIYFTANPKVFKGDE